MKILTASILALGLAVAGGASAQDYYGGGRYDGARYNGPDYRGPGRSDASDYARVLSVRPVMDGYRSYRASSPRCYQRRDTYGDTYAGNGYGDDRGDRDYYARDYYANDDRRYDGYRNDGGYRNDRVRDYGDYGDYDRGYRSSDNGRTIATVVGGIVGAALGSQMGGGSARYATAAVGSMVGGIAGQKIYESSSRNRYQRANRSGVVTVCDPMPDDRYYGNTDVRGGVQAYDVVYQYAGRQYSTRTAYHPGDRIRVRVNVQPD